jgi:3-phosphoshikimate 1-carboxyvinyltransferase
MPTSCRHLIGMVFLHQQTFAGLRRPIAPLATALRALGIAVEAPTGCPPVTIHGHGFGGDASLSSQYVSALLMLAAGGNRPVRVALQGDAIGARGYIDPTITAMRSFGAQIEQSDSATWTVALERSATT